MRYGQPSVALCSGTPQGGVYLFSMVRYHGALYINKLILVTIVNESKGSCGGSDVLFSTLLLFFVFMVWCLHSTHQLQFL